MNSKKEDTVFKIKELDTIFVSLVSCELEGLFIVKPPKNYRISFDPFCPVGWENIEHYCAITNDGTIKFTSEEITQHFEEKNKVLKKLEFCSPPVENLERLYEIIKPIFPYGNSSCGGHFRIGFYPKVNLLVNGKESCIFSEVYYKLLFSFFFYEYFLIELEKWGMEFCPKFKNFWTRLEGENIFCRRLFNPYEQCDKTNKDSESRRCHINFDYSMRGPNGKNRNTVEFRIPPMFPTPELQISCYQKITEIVENFLCQQVIQYIKNGYGQKNIYELDIDVFLDNDELFFDTKSSLIKTDEIIDVSLVKHKPEEKIKVKLEIDNCEKYTDSDSDSDSDSIENENEDDENEDDEN